MTDPARKPEAEGDPMRQSILAYLAGVDLRWLRAASGLVAALQRHERENPEAASRLSDSMVEHLRPSELEMVHRAVWLNRTNYAPPFGWTREQWRAVRGRET